MVLARLWGTTMRDRVAAGVMGGWIVEGGDCRGRRERMAAPPLPLRL